MLLVLALLWGGFAVWWLRSRAQGTFGDSVGTFRRHLHVLERAAPTTVRPANRLRGPQMVPAYRPPSRPPSRVPGVTRGAGGPARRPAIAIDHRRRLARKRRRDVLFLLVVAVLASLVMAAATRAHALMYLQLLADLALASYVALLVRLRTLGAERDVKLAYLPSERAARSYAQDHTGEVAAPSAPRRRPRPAYGSYGELGMRQAAN